MSACGCVCVCVYEADKLLSQRACVCILVCNILVYYLRAWICSYYELTSVVLSLVTNAECELW